MRALTSFFRELRRDNSTAQLTIQLMFIILFVLLAVGFLALIVVAWRQIVLILLGLSFLAGVMSLPDLFSWAFAPKNQSEKREINHDIED